MKHKHYLTKRILLFFKINNYLKKKYLVKLLFLLKALNVIMLIILNIELIQPK